MIRAIRAAAISSAFGSAKISATAKFGYAFGTALDNRTRRTPQVYRRDADLFGDCVQANGIFPLLRIVANIAIEIRWIAAKTNRVSLQEPTDIGRVKSIS